MSIKIMNNHRQNEEFKGVAENSESIYFFLNRDTRRQHENKSQNSQLEQSSNRNQPFHIQDVYML